MPFPSESLIKLRELIPTLPVPSFSDITLETYPNQVEMDMESGIGFGFNLFFQKDIISVARWFSDAGAFFPMHSHPEFEVIIVYSGDMTLQLCNSKGEREKEECLYSGRSYYLESDTLHSAYFTSDTWYIALTIPSSEAWPHG